MRTVKELISSGKYRKELDPILNSFLKHQLKHKGFLKEDYSLYDLKKYYDEETNTYYIDYELRDVSLDVAKVIKLNELAEIKSEKLASFEFKGKIYQIDDNSKININGKISAILLSQNTEAPIQSVAWIAKDNSITQFTTAEFLAFSQEIANYIETILFKNDKLRNAINQAKSLEALNKINLNFGG